MAVVGAVLKRGRGENDGKEEGFSHISFLRSKFNADQFCAMDGQSESCFVTAMGT